MAVSMQNWQSKSELELMRAIYCETYKMVRNSEPPPLPIERWESLNWLSVATEKLLDEHLEVAEDLSSILDKIDQDETCRNAMSQVHNLVRQGD